MHTSREVNAVAEEKECRVQNRKHAFYHSSMSDIDLNITKYNNR